VSPEHPVVISHFETHNREIELDAVADQGHIVLQVLSEHVEDAGVHSGDATLVLPPQRLYVSTVNKVKRIGAQLAKALEVTGPFNIQFLARHDSVKVIECNLRASRSFPFASKVTGIPLVPEATRRMLSAKRVPLPQVDPLSLPYAAVKAPQFSFRRLRGADPVLGVEMASTGEAACFGDSVEEALLKAMLATGFRIPKKAALLSLGPVGDKYRFTDEARLLTNLGLRLYATEGTADVLLAENVACERVDKGETRPSRVAQLLEQRSIDLVVNVPRLWDASGRPDGDIIRRLAVDLEIPLLTDLWLARRVVRAMAQVPFQQLKPVPWHEYNRHV
jgi:biotin carboxylase